MSTNDITAANTHAQANANEPTPPAHEPTPEPANAPTDAPTHMQALAPPSTDVHANAAHTLDLSDLRDESPGTEEGRNPLSAIRDAVAEYQDERQRERAADDSHTLPAETARRWHRFHKDSDSQTPRRKRGSFGWRR